MHVDDLIERLRNSGFEVWAYSGRHMYGAHCIAATVERLPDLALLGPALHKGLEIDHLARAFVAYWPDAQLPTSHELLEFEADQRRQGWLTCAEREASAPVS